MTTPGPWAVSPTKHRTLIVSAQGFWVTALEEVSDADARLIAAAPDLLNAVRFLLSNPDNRISSADLNAAHAAIANAMGGQP